MKPKILDFLKTFSFNLLYYLEIGEFKGESVLISDEPMNDSVLINYIIEKTEEQLDVFILSTTKSIDFTIFDEFTIKLKEYIEKEKSENKVVESEKNKGWYSWNSLDGSVSFALKNEPVLFEARFSFDKY